MRYSFMNKHRAVEKWYLDRLITCSLAFDSLLRKAPIHKPLRGGAIND